MSAALGERLAVALAVALGLLFLVEGVALRRRGRAASTPRTGGAAGASRPKATRAETAAATTAAATTAAPETEPEPETPTRRRVDGPEGDRQAPVARLAASLAPRLARREVVVAAVVVGAALRLAWVVWATRTPTGLRDPAEYLRIAVGLTEGDLPRFGGGGGPSAFWPPGYPALLAPFVWVARETGWASTAFVASLVNVVAGTASVALAGVLAGQWLGRSARAVAAWLVALAPGLVFWTSTPHTETAFTPFLLGALVLASAAADRPSTRRWALVGVLAAAAFLVRSPGVIVLAAPALALRGRTGTWRGALRPTLVTVAVAAALLVPWTVRNGVQVGFWSPASTNNAGAVCFGHHDDALPLWEPEKLSQRIQDDCYGTSPYAERRFAELYRLSGAAAEAMPVEVDEAAWYREATGKGVRWALTHPLDELRLDVHKVWETWSSEGRVVDGARNFEDPGWAGRWHGPLEALADWWGWLVGALALAGLATSAACRRALVLWVPINAVPREMRWPETRKQRRWYESCASDRRPTTQYHSAGSNGP
ncbi:MAG: glycosyltransferase family 39 protein, partial [Acidimicrobiales bacterium]|nr:glycosyltransferase family 39 protein [Acidimicrobiales bacterium]